MIALVEYSWLQIFFLFSPLNLSCHSLLACRLCWKIHWQPYGVSLLWNGFLLAAFAILSLSLLSSIFNYHVSQCGPPWVDLFWGLSVPPGSGFVSFLGFERIFSLFLQIFCLPLLSSWNPYYWMLFCLMVLLSSRFSFFLVFFPGQLDCFLLLF